MSMQLLDKQVFRFAIAVIIPVIAAVLQRQIMPYIPIPTWLLMSPALFISAWLGGLRGGIFATAVATALGIYFFIPHQDSWLLENVDHLFSIATFSIMGVLFSFVFEKLKQSQIALQEANARQRKMNQDSEARWQFALEGSNQGVWDWDIISGKVFYSSRWKSMLGFGEKQVSDSLEEWSKRVHPDDLGKAMKAIQKHFEGETPFYQSEHRIKNRSDEYLWVLDRGMVVERDSHGQPIRMIGTHFDMTERKLMENRIREKRRLLADSQAIAHIGSWVIELESQQVKWSDETFRLFGLSPETDAAPKADQFLQLLHPDDRFTMKKWLYRCQSGIKPAGLEFRIVDSLGNQRWLLGYGGLERNQNGEPSRIMGTLQDITERKHLEMERQRWADAFHYCAQGITISDPVSNCIVVCNPAYAAMLGYDSPKDLVGKWVPSLYAVENSADIIKYLQLADQLGQNRYDSVYRHANGTSFDVQVAVVSVRDTNNAIIYRVATAQDISQRKRDEEVLLLQSSALKTAANAIIITDHRGVVQWINPAFTILTGYSSSEAIGQRLGPLINSGQQSPSFFKALWQTISTGNVWQGELINRRKDGTFYTEEQVITPVFDEQGVIHHYISIKQDVSGRKQSEIELTQYRDHLEQLVEERTMALESAKQEAERMSQVKSAFLANMSHEIRTPMNAVLGFCYLLEQRSLDNETRQLVQKIHNAGQSLLTIINDILDFSKIEAGRIEIESYPFRLSEIVNQIAELMASFTRGKAIELIIKPPLDIDGLIGDRLRLQQVLTNLVSNAIKFTEQGEVELRIRVESENDQNLFLRFEVRDTGIGISADKQREIFSPFTQADSSISRRFGGTGLGLAICQHLIQLMGGELQVNSVEGQGSKFWFVLPLHRDFHSVASSPLIGLDVLVADASPASSDTLSRTLISLGWKADVVDSGEDAFAHFVARWENHSPHDLIILDWKMPDQDGLTTADAIQQLFKASQNRSPIPILIMVATDQHEALLAQPGIACVDRIITRPITPSSLLDSVASVLSRHKQACVAEASLATPNEQLRIQGVRVLVVDDSEINREVALNILEADGAIVSTANDGEEAVNWLKSHSGAVDIVLMDIQMPVMDGYTATQKIRQDERLQQLPVIALTAGAFESLKDAAFEAGMNDFLTKPFNVEQLISIIQRHTGCYTEAPESRPELHDQPISTENLAFPGIDVDTGLVQWGSEAVFLTYLNKFVERYADSGREISQYADQNDYAAAKALAHKLKGVSGNLSLPVVMAQAQEVDAMLAAGQLNPEATQVLQEAIDQVCESIIHWENKNIRIDESQNTADFPKDPAELAELREQLEQLVDALNQDNPDFAEPLLAGLQDKLPSADYERIKNQLADFDFQAAITSTQALIKRL
ncbi:PAS domain-containing protein [Methylicorpusculum sp.]|uniref:PAS domain-containing protein n=2 Tax=Methylicorpusculum sp. TaxID=2713644 RepID=UPI0027313CCE|nr:PAS domain-containing protein [Methylicorpusculum sp.]MDP2180010.1 PAS domain S-box protein [Methylicorpusculum sp.]MDP3528649.1 PAS domain S-box protein [Methylicorpusculum sp.]